MYSFWIAQFCQYQSSDWLSRPSPKWPKLCRWSIVKLSGNVASRSVLVALCGSAETEYSRCKLSTVTRGRMHWKHEVRCLPLDLHPPHNTAAAAAAAAAWIWESVVSPEIGLWWTCPTVHPTFSRGCFRDWWKSGEEGGIGSHVLCLSCQFAEYG